MTSPQHRVRPSHRTLRLSLGTLAAALVLAGAPSHLWAQDPAAAAPTAKAASAGVYSEPQARRGEAAYRTNCVSCHSAKAYTGESFKLAWVSRSAYDIFDVIRTLMPEDNPGALPRQDYVDIVAYMLSLNGYPAGSAELPPEDDALKSVKIDDPPPPGPAAVGADRGRARRAVARR